ncbi:MAG TPA: anthrone oxygenase family protein [Pyrinomonadaceae bacterium]|nr:anthrone oxygenase family protein [Pyrinomonadaceae bacterium]
MPENFSFARLFIWVFVIVLGIELGAGLYETLVVLPTWTYEPPASVLEYYKHNAAFPQFAIIAGPRFWMFQTPFLGLVSLITIITGLRTDPEHRKWRIIGAGLALFVVVCTLAWFVPNLLSLIGDGVTKMSSEQITSVTHLWVRLNWVRVIVYSAAWLAGLKAMTVPVSRGLDRVV